MIGRIPRATDFPTDDQLRQLAEANLTDRIPDWFSVDLTIVVLARRVLALEDRLRDLEIRNP